MLLTGIYMYSDSNLRAARSVVRLTDCRRQREKESESVAAGSNGADHVARERRVVTIEIEVTLHFSRVLNLLFSFTKSGEENLLIIWDF